MLFSFDRDRASLQKFWIATAGMQSAMTGAALLVLFKDHIPTYSLLTITALSAIFGLCWGLHVSYRSRLGTTSALYRFVQGVLILQLMFGGVTAAMAMIAAGRYDLRWVAFCFNALLIIGSVILGMYLEAKSLGVLDSSKNNQWKIFVRQHINYKKKQFNPSLNVFHRSSRSVSKTGPSAWLVGALSANLCLLFDYFGGGKLNIMFFAFPVLTGIMVYVNVSHYARSIVPVILLRKWEKEYGYKLANADLAKFQELRRTFFLSRWLMKDYLLRDGDSAGLNQKNELNR